VEKKQILLIVPYDSDVMIAGPIRGGWVPKRSLQASIGLGPLVVNGVLHVSQTDQISIQTLARSTSEHHFMAMTEAQVTSAYDPDWKMDTRAVFVGREMINYVGLLAMPPDLGLPLAPGERPVDAFYRGLKPQRPR
jgi:hypothetical protein